MNPNPEGLRDLDTDLDVFVAGQDQGVSDRAVPRKLNQIRDDQRIHPLLLAPAVHQPETQLGIRGLADQILFDARTVAPENTVIPVNAKQAAIGSDGVRRLD